MKKQKPLSILQRALRTVLIAVGLTPVVMYVYFLGYGILKADSLLFQPSFASYDDTDEILKIPVDGNEFISARWYPNSNAVFTVLHSHGNAEDLGFLELYLQDLVERGFSVFAYDYRGYGTSAGIPTAENATADAEAAYRYLTDELGIRPKHIIVHGRSVGAGVAILLARNHPVAGLICESAFTSAFRVVTRVRIFPVDRFPNLSRIGQVKCPVLFIHGTNDATIPLWHSEALYAKAAEPKSAVWISDGEHDNLAWIGKEPYWRAWEDFRDSLRREQE